MCTHGPDSSILAIPDGIIDLRRRVVRRGGKETALTIQESRILGTLARSIQELVSNQTLYREVWGHLGNTSSRKVAFAICRLRKKVEVDPAKPQVLITVRGCGFRLVASNGSLKPKTSCHDALLRGVQKEFFGRQDERKRILEVLLPGALVTLTGPGGAGKTHLAFETLDQISKTNEPSGLYISQLETAQNQWDLLQIVAQSVGLGELKTQDDLLAVKEIGQFLLSLGPSTVFLDNCEQIIQEVASTLTILRRIAPEVAWLITSRERLSIHSEHVIRLEALPTQIGVALFLNRIDAQGKRPQKNRHSLSEVTALVEALEGSPLAIELAAARARAFPIRALTNRLAKKLEWLKYNHADQSSRHQSLRVTIDWSWDLLLPPERKVLMQCAAWPGGFSLNAFTAVVCEPTEAHSIIHILESLLDKSLVNMTSLDEKARFTIPVVLREYLHEKQQQNPSLANVLQSTQVEQARYFSGLQTVTRTVRNLVRSTVADCELLQREKVNLQAALATSQRLEDSENTYRLTVAVARAASRWSPNQAISILDETLNRHHVKPYHAAVLHLLKAHTLTIPGDIKNARAAAQRCVDIGKNINRNDLVQLAQLFLWQTSMKGTLDELAEMKRTICIGNQERSPQVRALVDKLEGFWLIELNRLNEAGAPLERAAQIYNQLESYTQAGLIQLAQIELLARQNNRQGALDLGQRILSEDQQLTFRLRSGIELMTGWVAMHEGELAMAEALFRSSMETMKLDTPIVRHTRREDCEVLLGTTRLLLGDTENALAHWQAGWKQALERGQERVLSRLLCHMSPMLIQLNQEGLLGEKAESLMKSDEHSSNYWSGLLLCRAALAHRNGDTSNANQWLQRVREMSPTQNQEETIPGLILCIQALGNCEQSRQLTDEVHTIRDTLSSPTSVTRWFMEQLEMAAEDL